MPEHAQKLRRIPQALEIPENPSTDISIFFSSA
jgi:hypothetical protein